MGFGLTLDRPSNECRPVTVIAIAATLRRVAVRRSTRISAADSGMATMAVAQLSSILSMRMWPRRHRHKLRLPHLHVLPHLHRVPAWTHGRNERNRVSFRIEPRPSPEWRGFCVWPYNGGHDLTTGQRIRHRHSSDRPIESPARNAEGQRVRTPSKNPESWRIGISVTCIGKCFSAPVNWHRQNPNAPQSSDSRHTHTHTRKVQSTAMQFMAKHPTKRMLMDQKDDCADRG